jgi:predicted dehydrogenase/threonine dehydrogenase-like Zn-dependent dehydrogenase
VKQIIQNIRGGTPLVVTAPAPLVQRGQVLIQNHFSIVSAGTEKMVMDLAQKSLLGKARERPDQVRQVLQKVRTVGLAETWAQVQEKLNDSIALGYSSAGVVLACGADVQEFKVGDRVASNGGHAGVVSVPKNLCARAPEGVELEQAAFAVIGSIALQGVRLAKLGLGETALVVGLGLVGQIAVQLLKAQGCRVFGMDLDGEKCALAKSLGAEEAGPDLTAEQVLRLTRGVGVDAVLIAAATKSNAPVEMAAEAVRQKGRVVAIGAVNLDLPRRPFYFKEAEFVVSCSYGPGRYDPQYEDLGRDYPVGHVRWTEQRNLQTILDMLGRGQLDFSRLITHRFPIENAEAAYEMMQEGKERYLAIALSYPQAPEAAAPVIVSTSSRPAGDRIRYACLGAGGFARLVLLPAIKKIPQLSPEAICTAGGLSAAKVGEQLGVTRVAASEEEVFADPNVDLVFCLTRHDQHARHVVQALEAGKHVFVEKPLALTVEELAAVEEVYASAAMTGATLMVGFNRRFSPDAVAVKEFFAPVKAPRTISIRFNAGEIAADHWAQELSIGGGRIIGEACHAIDLATYLAGSPPVRVFAESIGGPYAPEITDDQCFITLRHANGSISNIAYLAGGDASMPKERVEVLGGGRMAVIDDFRERTLAHRGRQKRTRHAQDKGHQAEIRALADALVQGAAPPIAWRELKAVSLAAILAVQSLREGMPLPVAEGSLALQAAA